MDIMKNKSKDNYTIIIGCGRLGANLANTLSDNGENVLIMDTNKDSFKRLSTGFGGLSIIADGTDFDALKEAEIEKATTFVAVTNHDNTNIMLSQMARYIFKTKHVIARLYDPGRELVYNEFDIDTICPAVLSAKEIDKLLNGFSKENKKEA